MIKGEGRRPIEYVATDDRSEIETAVRFYEKLMGDDKVDLILPPWGTAMNFAVAPIANKHGYPMIGPTVSSNKLKELSLPYFYAILQQPDSLMQAMVEWLGELQAQGKVSKLGLAYVNDLFGIEMHASATAVLKSAGLSPTETKNYRARREGPRPCSSRVSRPRGSTCWWGLTYPPDNILLTTQAKETDFNPPVYFTAVGTAFPFYRDRFKGAEGVSGIAGWNPKVKTPGAREYFDAHVKKTGKEPDRWASAFAYASLQIIERCVGEVGLDRKRIKDMLDATEFTTVVGPVRFTRGVNTVTPGMVGQWQKGEFEIVWPKSWATAAAIVPKPAWGYGGGDSSWPPSSLPAARVCRPHIARAKRVGPRS